MKKFLFLLVIVLTILASLSSCKHLGEEYYSCRFDIYNLSDQSVYMVPIEGFDDGINQSYDIIVGSCSLTPNGYTYISIGSENATWSTAFNSPFQNYTLLFFPSKEVYSTWFGTVQVQSTAMGNNMIFKNLGNEELILKKYVFTRSDLNPKERLMKIYYYGK